MQRREFVAPVKGGGKDIFEKKEVSPTDFMLFIIYMATFATLAILNN